MRYLGLVLLLIISLSGCRLLAEQAQNTPEPIVTENPIASIQPTTAATLAPTATSTPTAKPTTGTNTNTGSSAGNSGVVTPCAVRTDWVTYIIVSGDTLGKIAQRAGTTVAELTKANCLNDANLISVGQTLRVPVLLPTIQTPTPPSVPNPALCFYTGYGIGAPHAIYAGGAAADVTQIGTIPDNLPYEVIAQSSTRYQLIYTIRRETVWVNKGTGGLSGNCINLPFKDEGNAAARTHYPAPVPDANRCYFYAPSSVPATDEYGSTQGQLEINRYYLADARNAVKYRIMLDSSRSAWVSRYDGQVAGNCSAILNLTYSSGASTTYREPNVGFTLIYPASWYFQANTSGLPGAWLGTFRLNEMPAAAAPWNDDMAVVSWVIVPPNAVSDWNSYIQNEFNNWQNSGRYAIVQAPVDYTIAAANITGKMYQLSGPMGGVKAYYFILNGQYVMIQANGNFNITDAIVNTLRIAG